VLVAQRDRICTIKIINVTKKHPYRRRYTIKFFDGKILEKVKKLQKSSKTTKKKFCCLRLRIHTGEQAHAHAGLHLTRDGSPAQATAASLVA
jgi:hypothetical protein